MLVHAAEEVCAAVYVEHNSCAFLLATLALLVVAAHFDPVGLERRLISSPFPPVLASDELHSLWAKLRDQGCCGFLDRGLGDRHLLDMDPSRGWYPLRREALNVLDSVVRRIDEELANEVQCDIIRDMRCGLLLSLLAIEVLSAVSSTFCARTRIRTWSSQVLTITGVTAMPTP